MVALLSKSKQESQYYKSVQCLCKTPYWTRLCGAGSTAELHHRAQCPLAELQYRAVRATAELLWSVEAHQDHRISKVHLWFSFLSSNVLRITWFLSY